MRICKIPKKSGGYRTIYKPSYREKRQLQELVPYLTELSRHLCPDCVHGFMPHRNAVTNAAAHVGYKFTLSMDLSDFFDWVTEWHVGRILDDLCGVVLVDGAARQGLPTSPAVANIAAAPMDAMILARLKLIPAMRGVDVAYTRYADDLTFSFNSYGIWKFVVNIAHCAASDFGFDVNDKKTHLQDQERLGRRVITGVAVDDENVYPTRKTKRKLRAARHQHNERSAQGLEEWSKLKVPKDSVVTVPAVSPAARKRAARLIDFSV